MSNFLAEDYVTGSQPKFADNKYVHVPCLSHQWQAKASDLEGEIFGMAYNHVFFYHMAQQHIRKWEVILSSAD
jgi:hypothetical protein